MSTNFKITPTNYIYLERTRRGASFDTILIMNYASGAQPLGVKRKYFLKTFFLH